MALPGLVAARNLADVADAEAAWNNLGNGVDANIITTNLVLQSQAFDTSPWSTFGASVSGNVATAPDGTLTADKLIPDFDASGLQRSAQQILTSLSPYSAYVFSVFAKAEEISAIDFRIENPGEPLDLYLSGRFDLSSLTVSLLTNTFFLSQIEAFGNGWYRLALGGFLEDEGTIRWRIRAGEQEEADGTKGILLWGAQAEAGTFLTPYKATTISPVTGTGTTTFQLEADDILSLAGVRAVSTKDFARTKGLSATVQPRLTAAALSAASGVAIRDSSLLKASPTSEGDFALSRGTLSGETLQVNGIELASISGTPFSGDTATSPLLISSFATPTNLRLSDAMPSGTLTAPERAIPIETDSLVLYAKAGQA